MNARRRADRRGYTLIEMILVIGGVSVILTLCGLLLHTLLRLDRAGRESLNDTTGLTRLARQFRADVRQAREAKPGESGSLELSRPDGLSVQYRSEQGRLVREQREGKALRRREAYAVGRIGPVTFHSEGALVRLVLARHPANRYAPPRPPVSVEARVDKERNPVDRVEARK